MAQWRHTDLALSDRARRGRAAVLAGHVPAPAEWRAVIIDSCAAAARLRGGLELRGAEITLNVSAPALADRAELARTLLRTHELLAELAGVEVPSDAVLTETHDQAGETAALPVGIAVAVVVGAAAVLIAGGAAAAIVVDRELARRDASRELARVDAAANEAIARHLEREDKAGRPLPLDAATSQLFDLLKSRQAELAAARPGPAELRSPIGDLTAALPWAIGAIAIIWALAPART